MKSRLNKEQSNHLRSLGCAFPNNPAIQDYNGDFYVLIELDDLLEILPKEIFTEENCPFRIESHFVQCTAVWDAQYVGIAESFIQNKELIDTLYELACWYYGEFLKSEKK